MAVDPQTAAQFELKYYNVKLSGMNPQHVIEIANQIKGRELTHHQVAEIATEITGREAVVVKKGKTRTRITFRKADGSLRMASGWEIA